jgi:hypothetical protein
MYTTTAVEKRNQQIVRMRQAGVSRKEVAARFKLSRSRIQMIEKQDAAERSMAERRARLREDILAADDPDRFWPVIDLVDALDLLVVTRKRLIDHFVKEGKQQISLRELMDMCLEARVAATGMVVSTLCCPSASESLSQRPQ